MEKRVIIAIVLCVGILALWAKVFPPPAPPKPAPVAATPTAPAPPAGSPAAAAAAAPSGAVSHPERQVELVTPDARFVLSSRGGTLLHAKLTSKQFLDNTSDPTTGHDVVTARDAATAPMRTSFPGSGFPTPADDAWTVEQPSADTVVFAADSGSVHIEKRYRADTTRYRLHLDLVVTNRGQAPIDHHLTLAVTGRQEPGKSGGGFFSGPAANPSSVICAVGDKIERHGIESLQKDTIDKLGAVHWVAADEKFFLLAAVPYPETPPLERRCVTRPLEDGAGEIAMSFASRTVAPNAQTTYAFALYAGPKVISDLEAVQPGGVAVRLDEAVDVSLAFLSRPILSLLKFFHGFAHNWGVAIILLTVFIKLLTFYPTQKSLLSGKKMQRLGPKMAAIRKKYENDRQRQSIETMNLYKAHGVSPIGGCLPSLIQMPIWIALYSTLNYAVELYRAPFILHIKDLTAKDPFHLGPIPLPLTPLLMGGVMFAQMKMSPAGADPQQQAMMSIMMPVMFTAFSLFLPSGLALYMLTSYLIGILQQLYVNRLDRKSAA
jgi:YidC/Oxa1 family membrane protein insertase